MSNNTNTQQNLTARQAYKAAAITIAYDILRKRGEITIEPNQLATEAAKIADAMIEEDAGKEKGKGTTSYGRLL